MGNYVFPVIILPLFLSLFILTRIATTLFHELGHAIPSLLFTEEKVTIFLGSYGNTEKSKHLSLGNRFSIYFKLNPFKWRGGMVKQNSSNLSVSKNLTILFAGPLFSLLIATFSIMIIFSFHLNGFLKLLSIIFLTSALFDLRNIFPIEEPILLYDGSQGYNDGYQIHRLIRFKRDHKTLVSAYAFYEVNNFNEALKLFKTLDPNFINKDIFTIIIAAYCNCKDYNGGRQFYQIIFDQKNKLDLDSDNFSNIAVIESHLGNNEQAMNFYNKSLELNINNIYSRSNRGYTHNLFENYNEAIIDFDDAIKIDPNFAYAFANRGYSKIKLGLFAEGLSDIDRAINLDDKNPYAYRNLGLYYLQIGDYEKAMMNLQIAFKLDPDTHLVKEYLKMTEEKSNLRI